MTLTASVVVKAWCFCECVFIAFEEKLGKGKTYCEDSESQPNRSPGWVQGRNYDSHPSHKGMVLQF